MKRFSYKKGLIFIDLNTRWQLIRRLVTDKLQFESDQGEIKNISDKDVLMLWSSGEWSIDEASLSLEGDAIYLATPADLASYPIKWQETAKRRLHYINAINPDQKKYNSEIWNSIIQEAAQEISDIKPPCPQSVHAWWKRYRISKSINALLPRRMTGESRKEDERYSIFEDVINRLYLNVQKLPVTNVVREVQHRITLLNINPKDQKKIKQIARSTIYRWVKDLRADIKDASRLGGDFARSKYRIVMGGLKVQQILERVELDHNTLDIIVIDELTNLPLGRPILTLAIDKKSRMVVGFYISFNPPSSYSVLQCLKQIILTKEDLLKRFPDIKNEWPAYGIPDLLAIDNGMDLHADAVKEACKEIGTEALFCPAGAPEMKGSIERFFKTINKGLIHQLPGTTFSNIDERGDYPSEDIAAIDLETLVHLITKWIVDIYNVTPHKAIGDTPLNKWLDLAKHRNIELPVYPAQLDVIIGIPAKRTVFHYGIELEGLHYNSSILQEVRKISGENMQVQLKFYEEQVAFIHVLDPYKKEYFQVNAVHEDYVNNLRRESHRLARVLARKKYGEQMSMPQLMESRHEIETIVADALKNKKMYNRKQSARLLKHDSNAIFESKNPIEKATKRRAKKPILKAPDPLKSGLDDELPNLKVNKDNDGKGEQL